MFTWEIISVSSELGNPEIEKIREVMESGGFSIAKEIWDCRLLLTHEDGNKEWVASFRIAIGSDGTVDAGQSNAMIIRRKISLDELYSHLSEFPRDVLPDIATGWLLSSQALAVESCSAPTFGLRNFLFGSTRDDRDTLRALATDPFFKEEFLDVARRMVLDVDEYNTKINKQR